MGTNLRERAAARAWRETSSAQTTKSWLWLTEIAATAAGVFVLRHMLTRGTSDASELFAVLGAPAVFLVCLLCNFFAAPYRQRDEARLLLAAAPKPKLLPNRLQLREAIAEAQAAAVELARLLDNHSQAASPYVVDIDALSDLANAQSRHKAALDCLNKQIVVAGHDYEKATRSVLLFVEGATQPGIADPRLPPGLRLIQYQSELAHEVHQALDDLDRVNELALRGRSLAH